MSKRIITTIVHALDGEGYQVYVERLTMAPDGVTVERSESARLPNHGVSEEKARWLISKPEATLERLAFNAS